MADHSEELWTHWELLMEGALENGLFPMFITDSNGRIVFSNKLLSEYTDISREDFAEIGWWHRLVIDRHKRNAENIFKNIKLSEKPMRFNLPIKCKETEETYFRWVIGTLGETYDPYYLFIGQTEKGMEELVCAPGPISQREFAEVFFSATINNEVFTASHSLRVTFFAVTLAERLRCTQEQMERIQISALLHDIGKLVLDMNILYKRGKLTKEEFEYIKQHPTFGGEMVHPIVCLRSIVPIIESHHENFGGLGYPKGISGEEILLESRIISVADIYEALTADRPYRDSFPKEEAMRITRSEKGKKLDPEITDIFLEIVREGYLEDYKKDYYWVKHKK